MKYKFEVMNVAAISVEHITPEDNELLDKCCSGDLDCGMIIDKYDGGFWIKFANGDSDDDHIEDLIEDTFSGEFLNIVKTLKSRFIHRMRIDCDTPPCSEFWELTELWEKFHEQN